MKSFFKFLFASILGVFIALFLIIIIAISIGAMQKEGVDIKDNTVLHIKLDDAIPELSNNLERDKFSFSTNKIWGLNDILPALEKAKNDDSIKGIFLEVDNLQAGFATTSTVRNALKDFKSEGKFIIAHSQYYSQGAYYLNTIADEVHLNPLGWLDFKGFSSQKMFFKDILDNMGIKMEVIWVGNYKSATEPFRRNDMSPASKKQTRELLDDYYSLMLDELSESRGLSVDTLRAIANAYLSTDEQKALDNKLIDGISYRDEVIDVIRKKLELKEKAKLRLVNLGDYIVSNPSEKSKAKGRIAVIYAEGTIVDGKGVDGNIGGEKYVKLLQKVRKDKRVKSVVLRINSGGGSAMASENMWREVMLLKESGKPVIVSMGNYAASGGYYMAAAADTIFAEPNTLTGSIGVFMMFPNIEKLMNDKLGIHFDTVKTADLAAAFSPMYGLSDVERNILQARTNAMYEVFLKRVSEGRDMTRDEVHEIAQGRVWTGRKGLEIGLVDKIGNLNDAITSAAAMSDLGEYRLVEYPKVKDPITAMIEELTGKSSTSVSKTMLKKELGSLYSTYDYVQSIISSKGMQMRTTTMIPFE